MQGSPYSPGAGTVPPILAGRDTLLHSLVLGLNDIATVGRRRTQDVILVGPRGVGKTAALSAYGSRASASGFEVVNLQAVAGGTGLVQSLLERAASRIARNAGPWTRAKQTFDRIASFSVGVAGVSVGLQTRPDGRSDRNLDPSTLAEALAELAGEVRRDAPTGGLLITIDEMQEASATDLALLAATLHRLTVDYREAPVVFAGTGLPYTPDVLRAARVTHPDRLFLLEDLPVTLAREDAMYAIVEPARLAGVRWDPHGAAAVVDSSNGYPAHLQLFAHEAWNAAAGPDLIELHDVRAGLTVAHADLARRTLGPRWRAMPERQMEYLAALALHGGVSTSSAIARTLGRSVQDLSQVRDALVREGDIYSVQRGHVALAVPIFASYVLSQYEAARTNASIRLASLDEMQNNTTTELPASSGSLAEPRTALLTPALAPNPDDNAEADRARPSVDERGAACAGDDPSADPDQGERPE